MWRGETADHRSRNLPEGGGGGVGGGSAGIAPPTGAKKSRTGRPNAPAAPELRPGAGLAGTRQPAKLTLQVDAVVLDVARLQRRLRTRGDSEDPNPRRSSVKKAG